MNKSIGQHCWHDFVIKYAIVKQVTLNVKDTDKINIVSLQAVLKVSSFSTDTQRAFKVFIATGQ